MKEIGQRFDYVNHKIRNHAKLYPCQNCGADDGTIVCAHSNLSEHGKCKGKKSLDLFSAFLCHRCHAWLDQGGSKMDPTGVYSPIRSDKREMFLAAMFRTQVILLRDGILK